MLGWYWPSLLRHPDFPLTNVLLCVFMCFRDEPGPKLSKRCGKQLCLQCRRSRLISACQTRLSVHSSLILWCLRWCTWEWVFFPHCILGFRTVINLPAPRRDSLGVEAAGQICQTGAASDVGPCSPGRRCLKVRGQTSAKCTVPIRHGRNIGPTWGSRPASKAQMQPNLDPLGSNFAPTWLQHGKLGPKLGPFGNNFGPRWGPYGSNMEDIAGPIQNPQNARFHCYLPLFLAWSYVPHVTCCVSVVPNLVWSCRQSVPSCAMLHMTWTSMTALGQPNMTNQRQLGLQLGSR